MCVCDVTVASSRSGLRAAQPLCASAVWGGRRSHFSVPSQKGHNKSRLRGRLRGREMCGWGRSVFTGIRADRKPGLKCSAISKLCPQLSTSALRSLTSTVRACVCGEPWRKTCKSQISGWRAKLRMRARLRWFWAVGTRLRPVEIPHAEEEEWIRLQRSCKQSQQALLCCCVSGLFLFF